MSINSDGVKSPAEIIEALRQSKGMTQQALAQGAGYNSTQALSKKLRADGGFSIPELIALARVLDVHPIDIISAAWPEVLGSNPKSELIATIIKMSEDEAEHLLSMVIDVNALRRSKSSSTSGRRSAGSAS